jgi:hypothetical protein
MTLDEAIKHCENVAAKCFVERSARNHSGKCGFEHLELAAWLRELKAYKEQEPCADAISRRDVKKYLSAPNENGDRVIYESDLDLLPSVTPTRKKGKWVDIKKDGNRIYRCRCSECGKNPIEYTYGYEDWWFEELPKFCPDCGIKMENEDI